MEPSGVGDGHDPCPEVLQRVEHGLGSFLLKEVSRARDGLDPKGQQTVAHGFDLPGENLAVVVRRTDEQGHRCTDLAKVRSEGLWLASARHGAERLERTGEV